MVTISAPTDSTQTDAAADLLAAGFAADPLITAVLPGDEATRRERLASFYRAALRADDPERVIDLAVRDTGEVVGVAIWHAPGADLGDPEVPDDLGEPWAAMERSFAAVHPHERHWYLSDVVVSDRARGEGVGSALLGHRLAVADHQGCACYLESTTPASRRMYQRLGFVPRGPILGLPGEQEPPEAMWRDPATPR